MMDEPWYKALVRGGLALHSSRLDTETALDLTDLEALVKALAVATAARDKQITFLHANGVPVPDLVKVTGLTRSRIYQIIESVKGGRRGAPGE